MQSPLEGCSERLLETQEHPCTDFRRSCPASSNMEKQGSLRREGNHGRGDWLGERQQGRAATARDERQHGGSERRHDA
jgi:hypothetical protein